MRIGDIVLYVLPANWPRREHPTIRPAIVTACENHHFANLSIVYDPLDDFRLDSRDVVRVPRRSVGDEDAGGVWFERSEL